jgi:hypothetical protein
LLTQIEHEGAAKVVKELTTGDEARWHRVISRIDTGEKGWLEVADKLLKATDAGDTEDLRIALAVALTHNPEGVLRMTGPDLPLDQVCTVPFIEPSKQVIANHKLKVRSALKRVAANDLDEKKRACLTSIDTIQ